MSKIKVYDNMVYFIFLGKLLGAATDYSSMAEAARKPRGHININSAYVSRIFKTAMDHALF